MMQPELPSILIVDDKQENILALETLLSDYDLNLFKASSGNDALKIAAKNDLSLILMDVQMPDMDGFETAELLRSAEKSKYVPIIFVTAINRDQKHIFKGYELGAVDYLLNPLEPSLLKSKVNVFIEFHNQKQLIARQTEALHQAQKLQAVGTLAKGIAHEFNNLFYIILGNAELLEQSVAPENTHFLKAIMNAVKKGAFLVKQLNTFSVKEEHEHRLVSVNIEIKNAIWQLDHLLNKKIEIQLNLSDELRPIAADQHQIRQMIANLCLNAQDALAEGGVLSIKTENMIKADGDKVALNGKHIKISVADNGHGMDETTRNRIFEPFFTTKRVDQGSGLGLAVVYGIVESHNGRIICESQTGQGTYFIIYLPVT